MSTSGERLRIWREYLGLTQTQAAAHYKLPQSNWAYYEKKVRGMPYAFLQRINLVTPPPDKIRPRTSWIVHGTGTMLQGESDELRAPIDTGADFETPTYLREPSVMEWPTTRYSPEVYKDPAKRKIINDALETLSPITSPFYAEMAAMIAESDLICGEPATLQRRGKLVGFVYKELVAAVLKDPLLFEGEKLLDWIDSQIHGWRSLLGIRAAPEARSINRSEFRDIKPR